MPRINVKRKALKSALGDGATLYGEGERLGWIVTDDGRVFRIQIDGEHDGSFAILQIANKNRRRAAPKRF